MRQLAVESALRLRKRFAFAVGQGHLSAPFAFLLLTVLSLADAGVRPSTGAAGFGGSGAPEPALRGFLSDTAAPRFGRAPEAGSRYATFSATGAGDNLSDTWVATDALGRKLPAFPEVPAPRADRTVGIFYFLWHGAHIQGGPFDVTKILAADPNAMQKPDSPLWGPLHVPHHWGELRQKFCYPGGG